MGYKALPVSDLPTVDFPTITVGDMVEVQRRLAEARAELERQAQAAPEVKAIVDFLATSTRGIVR